MHKSDMAAIDKCFDSSSDDEGNTHPAKASCTNDHDAPVELPTGVLVGTRCGPHSI